MHLPYPNAAADALLALYVSAALACSVHALLTKPDPRSALGWIGLCCFFPIAGSIFYALFGINRVRERAKKLKAATSVTDPLRMPCPPDEIASHVARIGDAVTQWARLPGNTVTALEYGEAAFPAMLESIARAEKSVWLATYIFQTDAIGRQFIEALAAAVKRGVQVFVLVDGVGECYSWPFAVRALRRAGVRAARFLPPRLIPPMIALNMRNHRKLLIVDGREGFVGGMNIGGRELGKSGLHRMADLHFAVSGPVVAQLAEAFRIDWSFAVDEQLPQPEIPPDAGDATCRVITEGPDEDLDKLIMVIQSALSVAQRQLLIMTPYFIPPPELVAALQAAALRGVDVSIVVPQRSNLRYVDWACRRCVQPLLARGVKVFLLPPPFAHSKLLVMDGNYALIGSANMDPRSLRLNFEIGVEIYHEATCVRLADYVIEARGKSKKLTLDSLQRESALAKLRNSFFWLFSAYL